MNDNKGKASFGRGQGVALAVCAALIAASAAMSWTAVSAKSATADEPLHAMGAYMRVFYNDFRLNIEDPPLFGYWAMIPHRRDTLKVDLTMPQWHDILDYLWRQWRWCSLTLYRTPGNDPDALIARSRAMMLAWPMLLGVVIAWWSWKLAGPVAAVGATLLYSFDPSFLGHGPLVKNDVPITLMLAVLMLACWSVGRAARWWNVLLLTVLMGVAINVKFSGVMFVPIVAVALLGRAILKSPWPVLGRAITKLRAKLALAAGVLLLSGVLCWAITWASYRFRYEPTPDPTLRTNIDLIIKAYLVGRSTSETAQREVTMEDVERFRRSPVIRMVLWADAKRILPHAWLAGLLDTYATTQTRNTYLLGELALTGVWYYFPLAMLFKTPLATLLAGAIAIVGWIAVRQTARPQSAGTNHWTAICFTVPLVIYGCSAIASEINLGLRHVFPLYPFLYILIGVTFARMLCCWRRATVAAGSVLAVGLIVESVAAWPDYIAYFNTACGGARGGFRLLGDSNLDWGQDLLLLRKWQQQHPDTKLYVSYFGMADPGYYLTYTALPGNIGLVDPHQLPSEPGIAAISATNLQGIYLQPQHVVMYRELMRRQKAIEVLGGTIYLFDVRP